MRFMVIVKATKDSEAGVMPSEELLTAMGQYNEELVKEGVMLAGEGLQSSRKAHGFDFPVTSGRSSMVRLRRRRNWSLAFGFGNVSRSPRQLTGQIVARIHIRATIANSKFGRCSSWRISAPR